MTCLIFSFIFCSLKVIHCFNVFFISCAFELPCVLTTSPFRPSNGAPPYSEASNVFNVFFNAGFTRSAPILLLKEDIIPSFTFVINVAPTPSYNFKITFPTKASHTITSASPFGISLASILPIKLISGQFLSKGYVSFTNVLPFSSSAPILTIATLGFLTPTTFSIF